MATAGLELDVWQGDWGLPSIDHSCLTVMAYCKFSSVPIKVQKANNPWKSPTGDLPILRHDEGQEAKVPSILDFLRKQNITKKYTDLLWSIMKAHKKFQNWGTDFELNSRQSADIVAYSSMLEDKLLPALLHLWWVDSKVYTEMTRPWYIKQMPFPFSYYFPLKKHKECETRLYNTHGQDRLNDNEREAKIYQDAKECLHSLSKKLGEKDFFFGKSPSSLDAMVFGYLAPLLKVPFPSTVLQNYLKGCPNLCQLCSRIMQTFFPQDPQELEAERKRQEEERAKHSEALDFPNRRRNLVVSGMVALSAMMGYAFLTGLVQVELRDGDNGNLLKAQSPPSNMNFPQYDDDEERDRTKENTGDYKSDNTGDYSQHSENTGHHTGTDNQTGDENANQ